MRLYTIMQNDKEQVAVDIDEKLMTLDSLGIKVADMNELIIRFDELKEEIYDKATTEKVPALVGGTYRILAPIPVPLQDVICLGVNYRDHIEETVEVLDFTMKKDAVYFSKRVNRMNDPDGIIPVYDFVDSLDYEVELGVVLGKDAKKVTRENALDCVFGYTIINDISARNIQEEHKQWYFGKSLDGFCPMGPCIVTAAEFGDPKGHALCSIINGELRQNSNTELMMQDVPGLLAELSAGVTLKAGTVIATGTPAGVAMGMNPPKWLQPGDTVECRIEGIGSLINTIGE